jgi:hypothetical protein
MGLPCEKKKSSQEALARAGPNPHRRLPCPGFAQLSSRRKQFPDVPFHAHSAALEKKRTIGEEGRVREEEKEGGWLWMIAPGICG